jgi:hypothetical protein
MPAKPGIILPFKLRDMRVCRYFLFICFALLVYGTGCVNAQSPVTFGCDLMSRYVWRGLDLGGASPSVQPSLKLGLCSKDSSHAITLGFWGAYTTGPTANQEADLYLSYTYNNMLSLSVTDYFFPDLNQGIRNDYFEYRPDSTGHVYEGVLSFNGTKKIPVTFLFAMNFYGNDARKINSDSSTGDIVMSKYLELGYKKTIRGTDLNVFLGFALDDPKEKLGATGYYLNEKPGIINVGIKASGKVKITDDYSLPLQCSVVSNPELNKIYMVFGISL